MYTKLFLPDLLALALKWWTRSPSWPPAPWWPCPRPPRCGTCNLCLTLRYSTWGLHKCLTWLKCLNICWLNPYTAAVSTSPYPHLTRAWSRTERTLSKPRIWKQKLNYYSYCKKKVCLQKIRDKKYAFFGHHNISLTTKNESMLEK